MNSMRSTKSTRSVKLLGLFMIILAAMLPMALAGSVTRSVSADSSGEVGVTLTITVDEGEKFYVVEETPPAGWAISNPGTGTEKDGKLSWIVFQGATSTTATYILDAPAGVLEGAVSGQYKFDGDADWSSIGGEAAITIPTASSSTTGQAGVVDSATGPVDLSEGITGPTGVDPKILEGLEGPDTSPPQPDPALGQQASGSDECSGENQALDKNGECMYVVYTQNEQLWGVLKNIRDDLAGPGNSLIKASKIAAHLRDYFKNLLL